MAEVIEKIDDDKFRVTEPVSKTQSVVSLKKELNELLLGKANVVAGYDARIARVNAALAKAESVGIDITDKVIAPIEL